MKFKQWLEDEVKPILKPKFPAQLGPKGGDNYGHTAPKGQIPGTVIDHDGKLIIVDPKAYQKHIASF